MIRHGLSVGDFRESSPKGNGIVGHWVVTEASDIDDDATSRDGDRARLRHATVSLFAPLIKRCCKGATRSRARNVSPVYVSAATARPAPSPWTLLASSSKCLRGALVPVDTLLMVLLSPNVPPRSLSKRARRGQDGVAHHHLTLPPPRRSGYPAIIHAHAHNSPSNH